MREILFKAKTKDTKQWIEGYPYPSITGDLKYITCYDPCCNNQYMVNSYEIDPETVCQYTWMTDKNGTKIFEWDKVKNKYGIIGFVEYGYKSFGCCYDVYGFAVSTISEWIDEIEVIGNIHDEED